MNMSGLDWAVVVGVLGIFVTMAVLANRLTKSVSDYLVAGRCAGRYMLTMASGMEWIGAINIVAMVEVYYTGGFTCMWWVMLSTPFIVYMCVSGWGVYRYRETRSMTIAQFLETRYGRNVRLTAGILSWTAGMFNFGFFPLISARLFISLIGLPAHFHLPGVPGLEMSTFVALAGLMVLLPLGFIVMGGHTSVMVSNFMQGLFTNIAAVIIVATLFFTVFDWQAISTTMLAHSKPDASMFNPLHASGTKDFNAWYFIIGIVGAWYGAMSNVPSQAFLGSGKTAHEQRMGYLLGQISWQGLLVFFMMIAICSFNLLNNPAHADTAAQVGEALKTVPAGMHDKVQSVATLKYLLPSGMVGLFCAIMMAALISSHNGFMHAWGGVLLQDIILPFRKEPMSTKAHIWALRGTIVFVGMVAFLLSISINPQQSILMIFAAVNSIWLGPAGAVMLGGLYWKKGTAKAAMTTLIAGSIVGMVFFVLQQGWPYWYEKADFPINGQYCFLINIVFSIILYVSISLLDRTKALVAGLVVAVISEIAMITCHCGWTTWTGTEFPLGDLLSLRISIVAGVVFYLLCRWLDLQPDFNMEKMLHRGAYAATGEALPELRPTQWWQRIFGITPMFNQRDRITAYIIVGWFLFWLGTFIAGMTYGHFCNPDDSVWIHFWYVYLCLNFAVLVGTTLWLGIGGIKDVLSLFKTMGAKDRDYSDTGEMKHDKK